VRTFLLLDNRHDEPLSEGFTGPDVRFPPVLPRQFIEEWTRPGDVVFDPFAGFGTTLRAAEEMGRIAWGIEWDARRHAYAASGLRDPSGLLHGDSRQLSRYPLPDNITLSFTSPPYMMEDDSENPFTNYSAAGAGYDHYLETLSSIYRQLRPRLAPGAYVVLEAANLKRGDGALTTLAWDVARAISDVLTFTGEIVVGWQPTYGFGYDHSYCLTFRAL
jgi:tRNA G10  N-methylase Trm11